MWMNKKKRDELWGHIATINHELGLVQRDVGWLKWLIGATFLGVALGLVKQFLGM